MVRVSRSYFYLLANISGYAKVGAKVGSYAIAFGNWFQSAAFKLHAHTLLWERTWRREKIPRADALQRLRVVRHLDARSRVKRRRRCRHLRWCNRANKCVLVARLFSKTLSFRFVWVQTDDRSTIGEGEKACSVLFCFNCFAVERLRCLLPRLLHITKFCSEK